MGKRQYFDSKGDCKLLESKPLIKSCKTEDEMLNSSLKTELLLLSKKKTNSPLRRLPQTPRLSTPTCLGREHTHAHRSKAKLSGSKPEIPSPRCPQRNLQLVVIGDYVSKVKDHRLWRVTVQWEWSNSDSTCGDYVSKGQRSQAMTGHCPKRVK